MKKYRSLLIFRFSLLKDIHKIHGKIQQSSFVFPSMPGREADQLYST